MYRREKESKHKLLWKDQIPWRSIRTTTTSLASSIFSYRREHGRTYHAYKDGAYFLPNDEREIDRLDLQHHIFNMTFDNRLYFAPINPNLQNALDIGTGTGIWAIDFADLHPSCRVIGTDLSPTQPAFVPPNLEFVIDDAEDPWLFRQKFDFIHVRLLAGSFKNWPTVIQSCYDALAPGGWLELQDYILPCEAPDESYAGTSLEQWNQVMLRAAAALGRPMDVADHYAEWMGKVGFTEVTERQFIWPTNTWPRDPKLKEIGKWNEVNMLQGLAGFSLALMTRGLAWSKDEVDVFVAKVRADMRDRRIHAYFRIPVVYGQKPL
ncbi:S-adenosyl-L-methionine-dependent methyltransferase [Rhizodiscina lignyota]|uniref:S-adenosyl-L-methionine-dependent methyltransferase n=1 Tax=Rhizodiscina lignyota TaxID=1504668 RepID=A0A9P4IRY1_9PEZI|nr:S-adenosyl-L-methionine-dependent methyltransferase [Rhizodiscina lignyota]